MADKVWVVCPFSKFQFTIGWITFIVDNELKVDNKLLFTITSPSSVIVKVLGLTEAMLNANDKVDKDDYDNDTEKEDIVIDEDYKEKDEDDDDDDGKVVKLTSKNEQHSYQKDDSMVLIIFYKYEDDEKLPKN
jgi:hypothetical protein